MEQYVVIIERGESSYPAYSPDVSGCAVTGATVEKVLQRMKMALAMHVEGITEGGDELPQAKGLSYYYHRVNRLQNPAI